MQLTYNKFKQVVGKSSERIFDKIAKSMAMTENAALVAMFDDKLILLDEKKEDLYLADYLYENGILKMHNYEKIGLSENDDTYLNQVVEKYFDLDDESPITVSEMMTGFSLKFKNQSLDIITEAKDRKYRSIMESPKIRAVRTVRKVKNSISEAVAKLWEEDWMEPLSLKADNAKDAIPSTLKSVQFNAPYDVTVVNTDQGEPVKDPLRIAGETNVMKAMTDLAGRVDQKWKSDSFRSAFQNAIESLLRTESIELARTTILNFLGENKELFLLDEKKLEELLVKTSLMIGETNTDDVYAVFKKVVDSKAGKAMKYKYFTQNNITEEKVEELRLFMEDDEAAAPVEGAEAAPAPAADENADIDWDQIEAIKSVLNQIRAKLEDDTAEAEYVDGLLGKLDKAKLQGLDKGTLKEIMDLLKPEEKEDAAEAEDKPAASDDDEELEL